MVQIASRISGIVIHEFVGTYKNAVEDAVKKGVSLAYTDLQGADLRKASFRWANLEGTDLQGADLRGANLEGANLEGADLQSIDLRGAKLEGAKGL